MLNITFFTEQGEVRAFQGETFEIVEEEGYDLMFIDTDPIAYKFLNDPWHLLIGDVHASYPTLKVEDL